MKSLIARLTALAFAFASLSPAPAFARDGRHDDYRGDRHYGDHHDGRRDDHWRRRHRDHDDDGEAIAAGLIGLALGALIVSAATAKPRDEPRCSDDYRYCAPPQDQSGYYDESGYDAPPPPPEYGEAAPGYGSSPACVRPVQQYDPHSGRYVWVNLRTAC